MKKIFFVSALVVLFGCDLFSRGPASVVQDFFRYVEKGEITKAEELLTSDSKQMFAMVGGLQSGTEDIKKKKGIKTFKIVKEDITGEMATVNLEIIYGN